MGINSRLKRRLSTFELIITGFAFVVLVGTVILMLPVSSEEHVITPFSDALFTSTSAVCVTGLVVHDTAGYWSSFGEGVILILIQIGGLGVVTVAAALQLLSGRKISLLQRSTMQESFSAPEVGGIVRLTLFVLKSTLIFELVGVCLLIPSFCSEFGLRGIWMALFHSVSAFCNSGFDVFGTASNPYQSLTSFSQSGTVNIVIMLLIVFGGIGFLTWEDVYTNKWKIHRYRLQSKVIFIMTAVLIMLPAVFFFFMDFSDLPFKERILASFFQAVTPRTAGFNTVDLNTMSEGSRALITVLMLIGGSPGSTAGGMKVTTLAVIIANSFSVFKKEQDTDILGRRIDTGVVRSAATIATMYISLFFAGAMVISAVEGIGFGACLFETASAIGTVGLTLGITPALGQVSRAVLIALMFFGRVGGLTLIYAAMSHSSKRNSKYPHERITVG